MSTEVVRCPSCGNEISSLIEFCSVCGTANPDWTPPKDADPNITEPGEPEPGSIEQYLLELFGSPATNDAPDTSQAHTQEQEAPAPILSFEDMLAAEPLAAEPSIAQVQGEELTVEEPVAVAPSVEEPQLEDPPLETPLIQTASGEASVFEEPSVEEPAIAAPQAEEPQVKVPPLLSAVVESPQPASAPLQLAPQPAPLQLAPPQPAPTPPLHEPPPFASPVRGWKPILVEGFALPSVETTTTQPAPAPAPASVPASVPADEPSYHEAPDVEMVSEVAQASMQEEAQDYSVPIVNDIIQAEPSPGDDTQEAEVIPIDTEVKASHFDANALAMQPAIPDEADGDAAPVQTIVSDYDLSSLLDQIEITQPEATEDDWPVAYEVTATDAQEDDFSSSTFAGNSTAEEIAAEESADEPELVTDTVPLEAVDSRMLEQATTAQAEEDPLPSWSPNADDDRSLPSWQPGAAKDTGPSVWSAPPERSPSPPPPQAWSASETSEASTGYGTSASGQTSGTPWIYDPSKPRPKPGTPEYEEMVRQAMTAQGHTPGKTQETPGQATFPDPTPAQMSSMQPYSPPTYNDPSKPRPKPGTPEYEEMVRQAMNQSVRDTGPLGNAPGYDTGPLPEVPPSPPTSTAGASKPKPGTLEYEEMVRRAMEEMKRKRESGY